MQDAICFSSDLRKSPAGENKTVEGTRMVYVRNNFEEIVIGER